MSCNAHLCDCTGSGLDTELPGDDADLRPVPGVPPCGVSPGIRLEICEFSFGADQLVFEMRVVREAGRLYCTVFAPAVHTISWFL